MENEKTIDVLNTLVQINNDRIEGYETALKETEELDLKAFFELLKHTSINCNRELSDEIIKLSGIPTNATKTTGKFFRVWMDVKAALTGKDRKAILNSCEYGEDQATHTYQDTIVEESENLSSEQLVLIKNQYKLLKEDHDKVKVMRDMCK